LTQWLAFAQEWRGWALCQLGDTAQGLALLEEGVGYYRQTGIIHRQIRPYYYLAEACFLAGRLEAALVHLETAHGHTKNYGEHYMSAETHRLYAEVLQTRGAPVKEIQTHLRAARYIASRQAARLWELRATLSLARLRHSQRRGTQAHALLAPLYASFSEGLDLPDLIEARTLLSRTDPL
jgi:predicted ATPase